jgi:hypothetical protein
MSCQDEKPVALVKSFFGTPNKPVTNTELIALKTAGIKELAAEIRAQCEGS